MKEYKIDREKLINDYLPFVKAIVKEVKKRFGKNFNDEELEAYGRMGLAEAAQRYDPKFSCSFKTYAYYRVKGAILDALRTDHSLWEDSNLIYMDGVNSYLEAGMIKETNEEYNYFTALKNSVASLATIHLLTEAGNDSEKSYLDSEIRTELIKEMKKLDDLEQNIIRMFYFEDLPLSEIAKKLNISVSHCSRIHKRAVEHLKGLITEDER